MLAAICFQFEDSRFRDSINYGIPVKLNGESCALFIDFTTEDPSIDRVLRAGDSFLAHRPDYWTALIIEQPGNAYLSRGRIPVGSAELWPRQVETPLPIRGRTIYEIMKPFDDSRIKLWNEGVIYTPEVWREIEPVWRDTFHESMCDAYTDIITYVHENLSAPGSLDPRMRIDVRSLGCE